MGKIEKILKKGPVEGQTTDVYPVTSTKAVYDENNKRLDNIIAGLQESVYLNTPIPISTENTPESMAQNVKNIADYVEKAKAAGIANVDGMAVTCIIYEGCSGVGYLYIYSVNEITIQGVLIKDDLVENMCFSIYTDGSYNEKALIVADNNKAVVTSGMLDEGARKPIILTPSTTEVDEETYQKLLSDDVDVVFKAAGGNLCTFTYIEDLGEVWKLVFTCFSGEGPAIADLFLFAYTVNIVKNGIHRCTIETNFDTQTLSDILNNQNYLVQSTLSPVLQEIDLTGTDAERKAKLDKFERDWKALTGASDLTGARFVGKITTPKGGYASVLFTYNIDIDTFTGVTNLDDSDYRNHYSVYLNSQGSLTITPLFSHLEAITIYTDNTPEHMQANLDNIAAYEANLRALGVDTNNNHIIPIKFDEVDDEMGTSFPFGGFITTYGGYEGFITSTLAEDYKPRHIWISQAYGDEGKVTLEELAYNSELDNYTLKSLNAKSHEAITIRTGNTPDDKAANVAAIKAYVDNLKALGVDVTKGYVIPCKLPNSVGGVLSPISDNMMVAITTNTRRELNCYEVYIGGNDIGRIYWTGGFQLKTASNLTTTSKQIVGAINEVNALAKGYSTIFTPIELTTETAQNKTAIDARVAAFTAQGISLTNGCCIPVTYKGVYAGNINLINGDWYGLLVKNTNNPADNINIKLSADGTIIEGNSVQ